MKLKKVINLFGGPGTGKSVLASQLFAEMKIRGYSVEIVQEYAKTMVFEERMNVLEKDQFYIAAKQHRQIFRLVDVVDYIITDSPFVHGIVYMNDDVYNREDFERFLLTTFNSYPNLNILLERSNSFKYEQMGRYQDEDGAKLVDASMEQFIHDHNISHWTAESGSDDNIDRIIYLIENSN